MLRLRLGLGVQRRRVYPQTFVWTGDAGDGLWSNPGNWLNATRAPEAIDEAVFASGSVDCLIDPSAAPVGSLTIQSGYSGTITQQRDFQIIYDYVQDGGTFDTDGFDFKSLGFHVTGTAFYARASDLDIGGHLVIGTAATFDSGTSHILHRNGYLSNAEVTNAFYKYETVADCIISLTGDVYLYQGVLADAAVFGNNTIFYGNSSMRILSMPESTPVFDGVFTVSSGGAGMRTIFGDYAPEAADDIVFNIGAECILGFKELTLKPTTGIQVINFAGADSTLSARGDMDLNADLVVNGAGWFEFYGGDNQSLVSDQTYITKFSVNKSANAGSFPSAMDLTSLYVLGGEADLNGFDLVTVNFLMSGGSMGLSDGGLLTTASFVMSGGEIVCPAVGSAILDVYGDLSISGGSFTNHGDSVITITGSDAQEISTTVTLPNLTINKASGTATLASSLTVTGLLYVQAGGFDLDENTVVTDTIRYSNTAVFDISNSRVEAHDWVGEATSIGTFLRDGSTCVLLGGTVNTPNYWSQFYHGEIVDSAVIRIVGGMGFHGESILALASVSFGTGVVIRSDDASTVTFRLRHASVIGGADAVWSPITHGKVTIGIEYEAYIYDISDFGVSDIVVSPSGSGWVLQNDVICSGLAVRTYLAEILTNGYDITCDTFETGTVGDPQGNLTLQGDTVFTCLGDFLMRSGGWDNLKADAGSTAILSVGGDLTLQSDLTVALQPTNVVRLAGTAAQDVALAGKTLPTIEVTADATATFSEAFTCTDFICKTPGSALRFQALETFTITGTLTLDGQAEGTEITIASATPGVATVWDVPIGQTVQFVDVSDCTALEEIIAYNSIDSGGNTNWLFQTLLQVLLLGDDLQILGDDLYFNY